eukprot:365032-Chlamydomonas_euryale.AAC.3
MCGQRNPYCACVTFQHPSMVTHFNRLSNQRAYSGQAHATAHVPDADGFWWLQRARRHPKVLVAAAGAPPPQSSGGCSGRAATPNHPALAQDTGHRKQPREAASTGYLELAMCGTEAGTGMLLSVVVASRMCGAAMGASWG